MRPVRWRIRLAIAIAAVGSLCSLVAIATFALVIHALLIAESPFVPLLVSAAFLLLALVARVYAFHVSHLAAFSLETRLRTAMSEHLAAVPLGFLTTSSSGALTKILQEDVKSLHAFVADSTPFLGRGIAAPVATLILLLWLDWRLALVAVGVLLAGLLLLSLAMRNREELQRRYDQENERISSSVVEFVQAMPVVRTFDSGSSSFGRYLEALQRYDAVLREWMTRSSLSSRLTLAVLGPLPTLLALTLAGLLLFQGGSLQPSVWVACLLIGTGLAESLMPLMWLYHAIHKARGSAARIQQLLHQPVLPVTEQGPSPQDASIVFSDVSFTYDGRQEAAINQLSFRVEPGQVVALVGPSGSGKSTVARLIPRFWDVQSGCIKVGGVDVRDYAPETLMQQVAFVFQDTFLFHDTLLDNIRLGSPNATEEEVIQAAQAAQIHEYIETLPQGYQTLAGDRGARLSGGQRQRITLARAILQNRPILILDEATAFADPENEAAMVKALSHLTRGKTLLVIAHRLNTIRYADQILVMNQGRLVESGSHDELIRQQGLYARLWQHHLAAQDWTLSRQPSAVPTQKETLHD